MPVLLPTQGLAPVVALAEQFRRDGERVVVTSGCFDLLHVDHVGFFERSRALGTKLVVLVAADEDVVAAKGASRPIIPGTDRVQLVGALRVVDAAILHHREALPDLLDALRPAFFTKDTEFVTHPALVPGGFVRRYVEELVFFERGLESTSAIIERCKASDGRKAP